MKNMYEIMNELQKAEARKDKIEVLRRNNSPTLQALLQGAFHPDIKFLIDEIPKYKSSDAPPGMGYTQLSVEFRRLYIFVEGSKKADPNLTPQRRKQILVQILEALEGQEAKLFAGMLMKDLKVPTLTYKLVQEAFPGLLPEVVK